MASKRRSSSKTRAHHASERKTKQHVNTPKRSDNQISNSKSRQKPGSLISKLRRVLAVSAILVIILVYLMDITEVSSNAMMPALSKGDVVLVFAPAWITLDYKVGDIAYIERSSNDLAPNFLRIMGLPAQTIQFEDDQLVIDGIRPKRLQLTNDAIVRPADEPEIWRETLSNEVNYRILIPKQGLHGEIKGKSKIEPESVFIVGDNRMASYDSRQSGAVLQKTLKGKPLFILYSSRNDGILEHWLKGID